MSNPNPGTENIKWIKYGGAVVIRGGYDESMIKDAESFLAEQAWKKIEACSDSERARKLTR